MANMVKHRSAKNTKISQAWWCTPVIQATQEAEAGECLNQEVEVSVSRDRASVARLLLKRKKKERKKVQQKTAQNKNHRNLV